MLPSGKIILKLVNLIGSGDLIKDSYCSFIICKKQKEFLNWRLNNNYSLRKDAEILGLLVKIYESTEQNSSLIA